MYTDLVENLRQSIAGGIHSTIYRLFYFNH